MADAVAEYTKYLIKSSSSKFLAKTKTSKVNAYTETPDKDRIGFSEVKDNRAESKVIMDNKIK
jgi:hypothetical protein